MALRMSVLSATRVLVAAGLMFTAACGGDGPTPPPGGVVSIALTPENPPRLFGVGQTVQLTATATDASGNPVSTTITWSTDNAAVATVTQTGLVTAAGSGTARIKATAGSIVKEITVTVVTQFNVNAEEGEGCKNPEWRNFRVETESEHLLIASDLENPSGGFTGADYNAFAATFESLVWPVLTENFGTPSDIDGNGKVIAFFTSAVNELSPKNSTSVVGGFFYGRDLFPKTASGGIPACPTSNEAEMFYMLVPDPDGVVNNNVRRVDDVRRMTVGVLGHEFQHLINSGRRLYVNGGAVEFEVEYMEEGLSHIAEELLFYNAGGLQPRSNLSVNDIRGAGSQGVDAFNNYQSSNFGRLRQYLFEPSANAPYEKLTDLAVRGAAWSWLRYLADRGTPGTTAPLAACAPPVSLGVGESCGIEGASAASFGVRAGEYAIVAFAADLPPQGESPGSLVTTASASGSVAVTSPPNPWVGPTAARLSTFGTATIGAGAQLQLDHEFHARLRRSERRELTRRIPYARAVYAQRRQLSPRTYSTAGITPRRAVSVLEPVWFRLVNSADTGLKNLRDVFGQDITGATRDWAVANYTDDAVAGVPAQYKHPSWFFRSVFAELYDKYPLQTHSLTDAVTTTMTNGGAAYYRLGVPSGGTSTVRFTLSNGSAAPSNLKLTVVRTK
jgi:hypothetical protein